MSPPILIPDHHPRWAARPLACAARARAGPAAATPWGPAAATPWGLPAARRLRAPAVASRPVCRAHPLLPCRAPSRGRAVPSCRRRPVLVPVVGGRAPIPPRAPGPLLPRAPAPSAPRPLLRSWPCFGAVPTLAPAFPLPGLHAGLSCFRAFPCVVALSCPCGGVPGPRARPAHAGLRSRGSVWFAPPAWGARSLAGGGDGHGVVAFWRLGVKGGWNVLGHLLKWHPVTIRAACAPRGREPMGVEGTYPTRYSTYRMLCTNNKFSALTP